MKLELRGYQGEAIDKIRACYRAGKRKVLLVIPTGGGKTVTAAAMIEGAVQRGHRVMFLAHRKELIDQPSKLLDKVGIDHGVIKAGHWRTRPELPVQVASVQTLSRRNLRPNVKIIIVDEAHRRLADMYSDIFDDYPDALVLGLTATPARLDGRGLSNVFDEMVVAASYSQLLEHDPPFLCRPRMFIPSRPDMQGVSVRHGEYQMSVAAGRITPQICGKIVWHWFEHMRGRPTLCFAPSVEKSLEIVDDFKRQGVRAAHVDGSMSDAERTRILAKLEQREIDVLSNVDLLVEGYDLPMLSGLILARMTKSLTRYLQMCGRVSRTDASKEDAVISDHSGCFFEHGHPSDDRDWSLETGVVARQTLMPWYLCEECGATIPRGEDCPTCGSRKVREVVRAPLAETDEQLIEAKTSFRCRACDSTKVRITRGPGPFDMRLQCAACQANTWSFDTTKARRASKAQRDTEYRRLVLVARKQGYKLGWALKRYEECFGESPRRGIL